MNNGSRPPKAIIVQALIRIPLSPEDLAKAQEYAQSQGRSLLEQGRFRIKELLEKETQPGDGVTIVTQAEYEF